MIERPAFSLKAGKSLSDMMESLEPPKSLMTGKPAPPVHGSICYRNGQRIGVYGVNIPIIDSLNRNPEP